MATKLPGMAFDLDFKGVYWRLSMLSQAEIDALLNGAIEITDDQGSVNLAELMDQGTEAKGTKEATDNSHRVQTYNFWSPDRFSKDQMRAVELVHEDLVERLTTSMPSFLRVNLRPRLVHTEQGRFHDFVKDVPANSLYYIITMAPLPGQMILTISPDVSVRILDQRLGGKNEGSRRERPFTNIDQNLLQGLVEHMLNDLKSAWSKVALVEPNLEDSTINQHWVQMMMGNDRVMLLTFELTIQSTTGVMNVYIPFSMLKPIANELNPHVWITGRKEKTVDPVSRQKTLDNLKDMAVPMRVILGKAQLTLDEAINLAPGDVIGLETLIVQNLILEVANSTSFNARIGKAGKKLAVQVISVAR
jgi:flagellar motor switch protein FliM